MKTIIAASDFSPASRNAINYAAEMALSFKARLVVLHVYSIPVMAEAPLIAFTLDELEKNCLRKLKRIASSLQKKYGSRLNIDCKCVCGFAVDEIKASAKTIKADLIVMGMQGAGYLQEKFNGSVTTALMAGSACPVMSIDRSMRFNKLKKIVLASDLKEIKHKDFSELVKELSLKFKATVHILNVFKPGNAMPSLGEAKEVMKLDLLLKDVKHNFNYVENESVVEGINQFVKKSKAGLVIMIGRKHSLFNRLFNEPQTKHMAFHANTPLLVFRD